jgi:hypothetical protein
VSTKTVADHVPYLISNKIPYTVKTREDFEKECENKTTEINVLKTLLKNTQQLSKEQQQKAQKDGEVSTQAETRLAKEIQSLNGALRITRTNAKAQHESSEKRLAKKDEMIEQVQRENNRLHALLDDTLLDAHKAGRIIAQHNERKRKRDPKAQEKKDPKRRRIEVPPAKVTADSGPRFSQHNLKLLPPPLAAAPPPPPPPAPPGVSEEVRNRPYFS